MASGYNNGNLTTSQVKEMQGWYGTAADGMWGSNSMAAASGMGANSAYTMYQNNKGQYSSYSAMKAASNSGSQGYTPSGSSSGGSSAANPNYTAGSTQSSYNNGGLTTSQIKEMQNYYGTTADGMWGSNSTAAAGGLNAQEAWNKYQQSGGSGRVSTGGSGYNNGGLTTSQIKEMQNYYGTTADGMWGSNSTAAAGGLSAQDAWNKYQQSVSVPDTGYGAGYDYSGPMSYSEYLSRVGGDDYQAAVQKAIEAQVQAAADQYNSQIESAGQEYEEAARRAYINKMMSQRNLDQELAANGVYGGMADSQRIATETNYENNLNDLTQQYQSTIADLQQAITSAKLAGDAQAAEAMANYLSQVQAQYASYLQNERAIQAEIDMFNRQLAAQQAQQAAAASSGSSGGGYSSGYSEETAAMQRQLNSMGANLTVDGVWGPQTQAAYDKYYGGTGNYTLTNRSGNGWIALGDGGRFTYSEIDRMIESGEVRGVFDDNNKTVTYLRVR